MLASFSKVMPILHGRKLCLPGIDIAGGQADFLLGALRAFEAARCPALLLVWAPGADLLDIEASADLVSFHAARSSVPVILHLDHGREERQVERAIEAGFKSVMFDGSACSLEDNARRTKAMAALAHAAGATIEGELGRLGRAADGDEAAGELTDPDEAAWFAAETGIDILAPAVGNAHGFTPQPPRLRFDLIEQIAARTRLPLSLHGGTGIRLADVRKAADLGVRKVNVASQIRRDFNDALSGAAAKHPGREFHWKKALQAGRSAVADRTTQYIRQLRTEGLVE